jgi:hypothetical protein
MGRAFQGPGVNAGFFSSSVMTGQNRQDFFVPGKPLQPNPMLVGKVGRQSTNHDDRVNNLATLVLNN